MNFFIEGINIEEFYQDIEHLFNGEDISINQNNSKYLNKISEYFEIKSLHHFITDKVFKEESIFHNFIEDIIESYYVQLEESILLISDKSKLSESSQICSPIIKTIGETTFLRILIKIFETRSTISLENLVLFLEILDKEYSNLIQIIYSKANLIYDKEEIRIVYFILHELYEKELITRANLENYFELTRETRECKEKYPFLFIDIFGKEFYDLQKYSLSDKEIQSLNREEFDIHKRNVHKCHNEEEILIFIREDNIEQVQEYEKKYGRINIQENIRRSEYEKNSIINDGKCRIIDYCAFFGSIKCFNYFLNQNPNYEIQEILKYAISGGHESILEIMKNHNLTYENMLEVSAKYHQHSIFEWIYSNEYDQKSTKLMIISVENYNFQTFLYLVEKVFSLFEMFISLVISNNYYLLTKYLEIISSTEKELYLNDKITFVYSIFFMKRITRLF